MRSVTSIPAVSTNRFAKALARGLRGGIFTASMPTLARTASERCGELPGSVADQETEIRGPVTEVHQEVADLLGSPRPVRMGCASQHRDLVPKDEQLDVLRGR